MLDSVGSEQLAPLDTGGGMGAARKAWGKAGGGGGGGGGDGGGGVRK